MRSNGRETMEIREPAVAGLFYPRGQAELRAEVTKLLAGAPAPGGTPPKALIAPHAGYIYSGAVAAIAFATLQNRSETIERVVLLGPAHYVPLRGIAAPASEAMATPLGIVPVDRALRAAALDFPFVTSDDAPHVPEHSLEVELPFLQLVAASFSVLPLVIGEARPHEVAQVLDRLWGGPETLVVVSSDLSHFHEYAEARRIDAATAAAIERGDWASLRPRHACGYLAISGLLIEAGRRGLVAERLSLCNSGDTAGSHERVVGYGAWKL